VTCPLKYRLYADHLDGNCPIFKVDFKFGDQVSARPAITQGELAFPMREGRADDADAVDRDGLEALITVPELPCDFDPAEEGDRTISLRTKTKKFLIAEAQSFRHKASHFPHNPYCEICCQGHMRQQSFSKKKERKDDGLPALTAINQQLSADTIVAQRSKDSAPKRGSQVEGIEDFVSFAVRDAYSGVGLCNPRNTKSQQIIWTDFKNVMGPPIARNSLNIVVRYCG